MWSCTLAPSGTWCYSQGMTTNEIARGTRVTMTGRDGTNLATGEYVRRVEDRGPVWFHVVRTDDGYDTPSEVRYVPEADVARIYSEGEQIA